MEKGIANLKKEVTLIMILCMGVGTIIGGDYLIVAPFIIEASGPSTFLAYLCAGVVVILIGLCYGELLASMPKVGGEYIYVSRAFNKFVGWVFASVAWLCWMMVIGVSGIVIGDYMYSFFPSLAIPRWVWGVTSVLLIGYVNYCGIKLSGIIEVILTISMTLALIAFAAGGFVGANPVNLTPFFVKGIPGFLGAVAFAVLFYLGFQMAVQVAEELKMPTKEMGKLIIYIVVIVGSVLVVTTLSAVLCAPYTDIVALTKEELPVSQIIIPYVGKGGFTVITLFAGLFGALTTMLGAYIVTPRLALAFARDGILPKVFGEIHHKYGVPHYGIFLAGAIGLAGVFIRELIDWVQVIVLIALFGAALVSLTLLVLRKKEPTMERPFRTPWVPYLPILVIVVSIILFFAMITMIKPSAYILPGAWLIASILVYFYRERIGAFKKRREAQ